MDAFARIVVGVDDSDESRTAAEWAARLLSPGGGLVAVAAAHTALAAQAGWTATAVADDLILEARLALDRARPLLGRAEERLIEAAPVTALLTTVERERATLLVVGSHGAGRVAGTLLGGVTTRALHEAPCSVLVARPRPAETGPVVAGVDGSDESLLALAVARDAAARLDRPLRAVAALRGKDVDRERIEQAVPDVELVDARPVDALIKIEGAELVVVGCRGLHGLAALGSVSDRVAHGAGTSVLVVRPTEGGDG